MSTARVNPEEVRFTQGSIANHFGEKHRSVRLRDEVDLFQRGSRKASDYPPIEVHRDQNGIMWSNNNRRLWVLRQAGVSSTEAKIVPQGKAVHYGQANHGDKLQRLKDPNFYPKVRGSGGSSNKKAAAASPLSKSFGKLKI